MEYNNDGEDFSKNSTMISLSFFVIIDITKNSASNNSINSWRDGKMNMDNTALSGIVFNIQRYSIHDGTGIRTLVFMKGCPLRCRWCSNPEGLSNEIQVLNEPEKCIGCQACTKACPENAIHANPGFPINRKKCINCGMCAKYCPTGAKNICGELKKVDEVVALIERDRPFYTHSNGGVTMGGGEILAQPAFVYKVLKCCRELKINTAIETSGHGSLKWLLQIANQCDVIHYDIKVIKPDVHKNLTGIDNAVILDNLIKLDKYLSTMASPPLLILRLPVVDGYNASKAFIRDAAEFIKGNLCNYHLIELLPFHNFGEQKYHKLDMKYELAGQPNTNPEDLIDLAAILSELNLPVRIARW